MTKPKFLTPIFIENALRFAVCFLALALTPFLGRLLAPIWDFAAYGGLRTLFTEVHTVLFWGAEGLAFYFIERNRKKRRAPVAEELESLVKKEKSILPLKNVLLLTAICVGSILLISAVIGFQVKPFYDIAQRGSGGYALFCGLGVVGRNAFKCVWIVFMLVPCKNMAAEVVKTIPNAKEWTLWLFTGGFLMLFGLYDVFVSVVFYPFTWREAFVALAYILFYALFPLVYYLTEEHKGKSYFIIVLIYLF